MKVLVLAAGYGTRLQAVAKDIPKALLPINNRPLLNYILDRFENLEDLNEVIVVTNNKFYQNFEDWKNNTDYKHKITVVNDGTNSNEDRLGSIGDINFVLKQTKLNEDLLVVGGDNLFDYDLNEYIVLAKSNQNAVTIGAYDIGDLAQAKLFGILELGSENKVLSFEEKPANPKSTLAAMCFYYLPKSTLNLVDKYLTQTEKSDRAGDYIIWLLKNNEVFGFKFIGKWYDIGSVEAYHEAQEKFVPKK